MLLCCLPIKKTASASLFSQVFTEQMARHNVAVDGVVWFSGLSSAKTIMDVAPLVTLEGWTVEKTREELEDFVKGAMKKVITPRHHRYCENLFNPGTDDLLALKESPEFLIDDLLLENSIAMVFGPTGSYKEHSSNRHVCLPPTSYPGRQSISSVQRGNLFA